MWSQVMFLKNILTKQFEWLKNFYHAIFSLIGMKGVISESWWTRQSSFLWSNNENRKQIWNGNIKDVYGDELGSQTSLKSSHDPSV